MSKDGYDLWRDLQKGGSTVIEVNGRVYEVQFHGEKTGAMNWLEVLNEEGDKLRLSPGWSSESCWNFLTTIEQNRWDNPVGAWRHPDQWF